MMDMFIKLTLKHFILFSFGYFFSVLHSMELDFPQTSLDFEVTTAITAGDINAIKELAKSNSIFNLDKELFLACKDYIPALHNRRIEMLIQSGANVNQQDENGNTILHNFFTLLTPGLVGILLATPNIDPSIPNKAGETPIDIAKKRIARNNSDLCARACEYTIALITKHIANSKEKEVLKQLKHKYPKQENKISV